MGLTLRLVKGSKLTKQEMDDNLVYLEGVAIMGSSGSSGSSGTSGSGGGGGIITTDLSGAMDLINNQSVIPGAMYLITGTDTNLYNGTDIILVGISSTQFSPDGYGKFYNPKYETYLVWDPNGTYNIGDTVIYGGTCWVNNAGNNPGNIDFFYLNTDEWSQHLPTGLSDDSYYNTAWDEINYDISNDFIQTRYELAGNNKVTVTYPTRSWFFCGLNPIKVFRWGDPFDGDRGIGSCTVENSYFETLNFITAYVYSVELYNNSVMGNITIVNDGYLENIYLNNDASISLMTLDNTGFYDIICENGSTMMFNTFTNSTVQRLYLRNDGQFYSSTINSVQMDLIEITNGSSFNNLVATEGNLTNWVIKNNTSYNNFTLTNTSMYGIICDDSYITGINLTNSGWEFITLKDSKISNMSGTNFSMVNVELTGFYLELSDIGSINNLNFNCYNFHYNTIKYQTEKAFGGGEGSGAIGAIDLALLPVPSGFFIEKVLVSFSGAKADGDDPILTMGITGNNEQCVINDINGIFSNLNNKIWVFDLSNGEITRTRNNNNSTEKINGAISTNVITDGIMRMEITLKNINYSYNND